MKKAVYTALFGKIDTWHEPAFLNPDFDYFLFTDQPIKSSVYKVIKMEGDRIKAREIKLLPHRYLDMDYGIWLWHDASMSQKGTLNDLLLRRQWDILIMNHNQRGCIYKEAEFCIQAKKGNPYKIKKQVNEYRQMGYPKNNGLTASGLLIRRNNYRVRLFNEFWYLYLSNGSVRDQISFSPALYFYNQHNAEKPVVVKKMNYNICRSHFTFRKH